MLLLIKQHNRTLDSFPRFGHDDEITESDKKLAEPVAATMLKANRLKTGYYELVLCDEDGEELDSEVCIA